MKLYKRKKKKKKRETSLDESNNDARYFSRVKRKNNLYPKQIFISSPAFEIKPSYLILLQFSYFSLFAADSCGLCFIIITIFAHKKCVIKVSFLVFILTLITYASQCYLVPQFMNIYDYIHLLRDQFITNQTELLKIERDQNVFRSVTSTTLKLLNEAAMDRKILTSLFKFGYPQTWLHNHQPINPWLDFNKKTLL